MTNQPGDPQESGHGPDDVERPAQGVDGDGSPTDQGLDQYAPRLAGKRADERDAQMRDEADHDPPVRDRNEPPAGA